MGTSSVTVSSPGLLPPPLTVRALKSRYTAIARNPGLAHDLYRLGYMELVGSGLDHLQRRLLERSWPLLSFRETKGQFTVELSLPSPQKKS